MHVETIVGVYDIAGNAEAAVKDLILAGIPDAAITQYAEPAAQRTTRGQGFWVRMLGANARHDTDTYDRSLASGSTIVTARVIAPQAASAIEILDSHHPIDLDEEVVGSTGVTPDMVVESD
jgi:hypothetical protein